MKKLVLVLMLLSLTMVAANLGAEERQYKRWKLDFERGDLDFVVLTDALGHSKICWYLTYKITNNGQSDVPLRVALKAKTDTKKMYLDSIAPMAQALLQKKTGKKYKNSIEVYSGTLAPGKSLDAVAFFGTIDPNYDKLMVHVAGLYDTVEQEEGKLIFEKKVLVLTYDRPGDEYGAAADEVTFKGEKWIIEGERKEIPQKPIR